MRPVTVGIILCVPLLGGWIATASWRWRHADMAAIFRDRIELKVGSGSSVVFRPGSVLAGDLNDTGRLVCGDVTVGNPGVEPSTLTYSIVVSETVFGYAVNDGFTPATRPENQAISDQSCASLRAHNPGDNAGRPGHRTIQPHR